MRTRRRSYLIPTLILFVLFFILSSIKFRNEKISDHELAVFDSEEKIDQKREIEERWIEKEPQKIIPVPKHDFLTKGPMVRDNQKINNGRNDQSMMPTIDHGDQLTSPNLKTDHLSNTDKNQDPRKITNQQNRSIDFGNQNFPSTDHPKSISNKSIKSISPIDCYGLCGPKKDLHQLDYVINLINEYYHRWIKNSTNSSESSDEIFPEYPVRKHRFRDWVFAEATTSEMGTQPKLIFKLTMPGMKNRTAVFKPKLYSRNWTSDSSCLGFDRPNGELGAYYLRRTMRDFVKTVKVIGIKLDLRRDLWPIRDQKLKKNTWLDQDGHYCIKLDCKYCSDLIICPDDISKPTVPGSLTFWSQKKLKQIENPWGLTCTQKGREAWRKDGALCKNIKNKDKFLGNQKILLDIIDISIFDFLIDNPDRHHFEYWQTHNDSGFILLDHGKAFSHPNHDDLSILAPLFQCCMIKEHTYSILRNFSTEEDFYGELSSYMETDPTYPFLNNRHLIAIFRRIQKVIVVVEMCIKKYGPSVIM